MFYVLKTIFISFYLFLLCILAFLCISYNSTINTEKFKSFVEVYPIEGNPIEVYTIEAYLIGKGVVGVSHNRLDPLILKNLYLSYTRQQIASVFSLFKVRISPYSLSSWRFCLYQYILPHNKGHTEQQSVPL